MTKALAHLAGACSRKILALLLLTLIFITPGCGYFKQEKPAQISACPHVAVVADTMHVTHRDAKHNILSSAQLTDIGSGCRADDTEINIELTVNAQRTSQLKKDFDDYDYYVAYVDSNNNIIDKSVHSLRVNFVKDAGNSSAHDIVTIALPAGLTAGHYEVLLGFQLSAAELKENRKKPVF